MKVCGIDIEDGLCIKNKKRRCSHLTIFYDYFLTYSKTFIFHTKWKLRKK